MRFIFSFFASLIIIAFRNPATEKKEGNSLADMSRENTLGSIGTQGTLNGNSSQKAFQNMMEYHKLSNLDIPKEIIHGNSKPEHFFGFQQNLRKQTSTQQRSPRSAQVFFSKLSSISRK